MNEPFTVLKGKSSLTFPIITFVLFSIAFLVSLAGLSIIIYLHFKESSITWNNVKLFFMDNYWLGFVLTILMVLSLILFMIGFIYLLYSVIFRKPVYKTFKDLYINNYLFIMFGSLQALLTKGENIRSSTMRTLENFFKHYTTPDDSMYLDEKYKFINKLHVDDGKISEPPDIIRNYYRELFDTYRKENRLNLDLNMLKDLYTKTVEVYTNLGSVDPNTLEFNKLQKTYTNYSAIIIPINFMKDEKFLHSDEYTMIISQIKGIQAVMKEQNPSLIDL